MSAWTEEFAPSALAALGVAVRKAFGLTAVAIGIKGDESHTFGYHRSRNWINSNGDGSADYSNKLALDRSGNVNWLAALDISLSPEQMIAVSSRLLDGMRDGDPRLAAVREFYGTVDGENVTGWDSATGRAVSSDDSHLWHVHISFYRSRAADDHSGVLAVLLGQEEEEEDMDPVQDFRLKLLFDNWAPSRADWVRAGGEGSVYDQAAQRGGATNMNALAHVDTKSRIDELKATTASSVASLRAETQNGLNALRTDTQNGLAATRTGLADLKTVVEAVQQRLERLSTGNIDPQALAKALQPLIAEAVATELAKRLAS